MSGLSALLPGPKKIEIDGKKYSLQGLSLAEFAGLLTRFPILDSLFSGKGPGQVSEILEAGNPAVGAIIAAGLGHGGDDEWEADAAVLSAQYQVKFLAPILSLTMPEGFGPFAEALASVLATLFPPAQEEMRAKVLQKVTQKRSQLSSNSGAAPTPPSGPSHPASSQPTAS